MRVVVFADVHGNLPALEALLAELEHERHDLVVSLGDVASGPMPSETVGRLRSLERVRFVRGNADRVLVQAFDALGAPAGSTAGRTHADWCSTQISSSDRDFLASFEDTVTVEGVDGIGTVLFCHGSPRSDEEIMTARSPDGRIRRLTSGVGAATVVCGHTHMQFDRTVDGVRVINPGSVGMPYGEPGAHWAVLGPGVEMRRTDYDREDAARRIAVSGWPDAPSFARGNVLATPSTEEAVAYMDAAEAKQESEQFRTC